MDSREVVITLPSWIDDAEFLGLLNITINNYAELLEARGVMVWALEGHTAEA
jgi:hypothetical protein